MSIITAKFTRSKDGYTTVYLKSKVIEDIVRGTVTYTGSNATQEWTMSGWEVRKGESDPWTTRGRIHRCPMEPLAQCGFMHLDGPVGIGDDRRGAISYYAITAVGLSDGISYRTRVPFIPETLRQAAQSLDKSVHRLLEMSRAVDITVNGVMKAAR